MDDHNLVQGFFQQLYDDISEKTNLCALKGSFVIDNINDIDDKTSVNLIEKLIKISSDSSSLDLLKSHTLFIKCLNRRKKEIMEIQLSKPLTFTCTVNEQTYEMQIGICKYYSFHSSREYLFFKFERNKTISLSHGVSAFSTYVLRQPRKKTIENDDGNIDEEYFFYHAENKPFEEDKHEQLVNKVFIPKLPNYSFQNYLDTKNEYNKCADFNKIKDCEKKCLSNDIYIPNEYIQNYFNKKLGGSKNKKGRKSRKNRSRKNRSRKNRSRKNRKIKKSRKYRKSRKL